MKKKLLKIFKYLFFVFVGLAGVIYYINFSIPGTPGFIIEKTNVYSTLSKENITKRLGIGESVDVLNYSNDNLTKIRYLDNNGNKKIGFIRSSNLRHYVYAGNSDTNFEPLLMKVSDDCTFKSFVKALAKDSDTSYIAGVYIESSDNNVNTVSKIETFCEEQRIPFGKMQMFTDSNYQSFRAYLTSNEDWKNTYEILPICFFETNLSEISKKYDLSDCIIYTDSNFIGDFKRIWISSNSSEVTQKNYLFKNDESIVATEISKSNISFSYLSDEFSDYISEAYNNINATQD